MSRTSRLPKVVLFSDHVYTSRRRAGFHWIAKGYRAAGWQVLFVTTGVSRLGRVVSNLRPDPKYGEELRSPNIVERIADGEHQLLLYANVHPMRLLGVGSRLPLGRIARASWVSVIKQYRSWLEDADHVIFESGPALLLAPVVREMNPTASFIYRVSDDLAVLKAHPSVIAAEAAAVPLFDLISIPSPLLAYRFGAGAKVLFHPHGVDKGVLGCSGAKNPYSGKLRKVVSIGTMLLDQRSANMLIELSADVELHVFGATRWHGNSPRIVLHGEQRFADMLPYVLFADVGAAFYRPVQGFEYLAHTSNKILIYTAAKLPIIAPNALVAGRGNVCGYNPTDPISIRDAYLRALELKGERLNSTEVWDWKEVANAVMLDAGGSCAQHRNSLHRM